MITTKELARNCDVTINTLKNDIEKIFGIDSIKRTKPRTGRMELTGDQVRQIYAERGLGFRNTIAVIGNQKGGVGKSLLTINIAIKKVKVGARVLIVDLDPESCATNFLLDDDQICSPYKTVLEVFKEDLQLKDVILKTRYEGLDIVPCRGLTRRAESVVRDANPNKILKSRMEGLRERYDLILFEVPPTFSRLIESAYITSDHVIMPAFPDIWSIESCALTKEDIEESCKEWDMPTPQMSIVLNKYNESRRASQDAWASLITNFGGIVLPITIRETTDLQNAINNGQSIFDRGVRSSKMIKNEIAQLSEYICPIEPIEKSVQ